MNRFLLHASLALLAVLSGCTNIATFHDAASRMAENEKLLSRTLDRAYEPKQGYAKVFIQDISKGGFPGVDVYFESVDGKASGSGIFSRTASIDVLPGQHTFEVRCGGYGKNKDNCPRYIGQYSFNVQEGLQYQIPITQADSKSQIYVRVYQHGNFLTSTFDSDPSTLTFHVNR